MPSPVGIIALITRSRCFRVISEMFLLLVGSFSLMVSSHFCCLPVSTPSVPMAGCTHSVCLFVCAGNVLLLEAIGCALMKFVYDLHTDVWCEYDTVNIYTAVFPDVSLPTASVAKTNVCRVVHGELFQPCLLSHVW